MKHSASMLITAPDGRYLLIQRSDTCKNFKGWWEFPGGKIDAGETPAQALRREVFEETAIQIELPQGPPQWATTVPSGEVDYVFSSWQCGSPPPVVKLSEEHQAFRWARFTETRKLQLMQPHRDFLERQWLQQQIDAYAKEEAFYKVYRDTLEAVLRKLAQRWAPLAIVQARSKSMASFAEKCLRKADKYDDPVHQLTDLCGARIIAPTTHEVDTLVRKIGQLFGQERVDELDDTSRRHPVSAFGYLSVHFIVHFTKDQSEMLGVSIPAQLAGLKAEIQVRTLLQHAHSEVTHDRLYKSGFRPPLHYEREAARAAALLESADDEFSRFVTKLDGYVGSYAAHLPPERRRREIADLKLVLPQEKHPELQAALALRIARLARAAWDWPAVVEALEAYVGVPSPVQADVQMELGNALCHLHRGAAEDAAFKRGISLLKATAEAVPAGNAPLEALEKTRQATALRWLGSALCWIDGCRDEARSCLAKALELAPEDPYSLAAFVELDVVASGTEAHVPLLAPSLHQAVGQCCEHIRAGIEVTRAWLTLSKLRLMLVEDTAAFEAFCAAARCMECGAALVDFQRSLARLKDGIGKERPFLDRLSRTALLLAKAKQQPHPGGTVAWEPLARQFEFEPQKRVLIFAGATNEQASASLAPWEPALEDALAGYDGYVVTGGTKAGICGLTATLAVRLNGSGKAHLELVGYLPEFPPGSAAAHPGFKHLIRTKGATQYSVAEPLQMWTDLLLSGVDPAAVTLLCIGGGEISAQELALAWALGARSAVIADSSGAAERFAALLSWNGNTQGRGMVVPADAATLRAFIPFDLPPDAARWERPGEAVHEEYLRMQAEHANEPNLLPWPLLAEQFKASNRHQAAWAVKILGKLKYVAEAVALNRTFATGA